MNLTICICTYNRNKKLIECLRSIEKINLLNDYLLQLKKTNKHIYLSTGMSNWREITIATKLLKKNYTLLQCSSIYPCPLEYVGINILFDISLIFSFQNGTQ